jgi:glycosyltransferase involved in cell wall biosynthesis
MTTDAVGGVWRYTLDLAQGYRRLGIPTLLAVLGPAPSAAQRGEAMRAGVKVLETGLPLDWTAESPAVLADTLAQLRALAARSGLAAAHLHAPALAGNEKWPMPVVAVAHSCVATWWRAVRGGALPENFRWRAEATGAGLRMADAVIAPTRAHAEAVCEVYGPVAIEVVHNGSALTPTLSRREREQAVLTGGRLWDEGKNAAALDRVAPLLGVPVRAAGPTAGPNGAAVALRNLELLGNLGPDAMQDAYARASVFASLAKYEPFGLSVLEAALSGMRLVLADIPSFRELWDGAATFVDRADALLPALRGALAQTGDGGARVRGLRYTLDATVAGTLAVHRAVGVPV